MLTKLKASKTEQIKSKKAIMFENHQTPFQYKFHWLNSVNPATWPVRIRAVCVGYARRYTTIATRHTVVARTVCIMRKHKSSGIPAPARRARQTRRWCHVFSLCTRNPFLSTCCAVTKTRSLGPLPYVYWMRIAGGYGSAHIKIGQGLLYIQGDDANQSSSGVLGQYLPWGWRAKNVRAYVRRLHNSRSIGEREPSVIGARLKSNCCLLMWVILRGNVWQHIFVFRSI